MKHLKLKFRRNETICNSLVAGNQQLAAAAVAQAAGEANPLLLHVGGGQHHVGYLLLLKIIIYLK